MVGCIFCGSWLASELLGPQKIAVQASSHTCMDTFMFSVRQRSPKGRGISYRPLDGVIPFRHDRRH